MNLYGNGGTGGSATPAGWYPVDEDTQRYWDGARWTDHVAPAPGPAPWHPGESAGPDGVPFGQPSLQDRTNPSPYQAPGYGHQAPGYGRQAPGYGHQAPGYGHQAPGYSRQAPGYSRQAPGYGHSEPPPFASGPYGHPASGHGWIASTSDDRTMALLIHLLGLVSGFLGPLVLWLVKRDDSAFVDHHGKQALNFHVSMILYWFITFVLLFFLIGILLMPVLFVVQILLPILAAIGANRGETYRYPLTIRFFS